MSKLLAVGTVAFDKIETPFGKTDKILGGSGTFVGLSASTLGDDFPQKYFDLMHEKGIDTEGIEIVKNEKTFFWSGKYHNDMNSRDTLVTELNVLEHFKPIVPESQNADIVMLGNLHPLVQISVLNQMQKKPKLVVLDTMNYWMNSALEDLHKVIKQVDVIDEFGFGRFAQSDKTS